MTDSHEIIDHAAALAYLFGRINYERNDRLPYRSRGLKLDRMRELLARLGNPEKRFPIVHVAGTKGKGSTSAMLAAVLSAAGYRTGLYTSPHLENVEERIAVDGWPCTRGEFVELMRRIRPEVDTMDAALRNSGSRPRGPTYFEVTTAAALLHFAAREVDVAVLEVGLGGRLDSTNVCQPEVCVITSISFDHTRQLGNTLAAIAGEKAGIIKPDVPVVTGVTEDEPLGVIRRIAEERESPCFVAGADFGFRYLGLHAPPVPDDGRAAATGWTELDYWEARHDSALRLDRLRTRMLGRHQAANAAVAVAAIGRLRDRGWQVSDADIRQGLAEAVLPARTEIVSGPAPVVLDAAHNVASVQALVEMLRESFPPGPGRRHVLVFAASQDKDVAGMLRLLLTQFDLVILTRFLQNPRAADPHAMLQLARQILTNGVPAKTQVVTQPDPVSAWELARGAAGSQDLVCVAGSFFLASELRSLIQAQPHSLRGRLAPLACQTEQ